MITPDTQGVFEDRIESLECEKLIALEKAQKKPAPVRLFAEVFELPLKFLVNPYDCWKTGSASARKLVMRSVLAEPVKYSRETGCLNTRRSSVSSFLDDLKMSGK